MKVNEDDWRAAYYERSVNAGNKNVGADRLFGSVVRKHANLKSAVEALARMRAKEAFDETL